MAISVEQTGLAIALLSSPLLLALFEFLRDKILAIFQFRGWQAVFLDSGEVYFGKITSSTKSSVKLTDIFYLKEPRKQHSSILIDIPTLSSLVKLGGEVHGPKDAMFIARDHIHFIENLKDDSNVVVAIWEYKQEHLDG